MSLALYLGIGLVVYLGLKKTGLLSLTDDDLDCFAKKLNKAFNHEH